LPPGDGLTAGPQHCLARFPHYCGQTRSFFLCFALANCPYQYLPLSFLFPRPWKNRLLSDRRANSLCVPCAEPSEPPLTRWSVSAFVTLLLPSFLRGYTGQILSFLNPARTLESVSRLLFVVFLLNFIRPKQQMRLLHARCNIFQPLCPRDFQKPHRPLECISCRLRLRSLVVKRDGSRCTRRRFVLFAAMGGLTPNSPIFFYAPAGTLARSYS